ncbi:MAG TPA: hypothetical protein VFQ92_07060 [Blastocatellia bacterium]|nr:hypothetical protein [Blastocatellia bacterium]
MSDDLTRNMSHNDGDNDFRRIERRLDQLVGMIETLSADLQNVKADLQSVKDDLQSVKDDLQGVKTRLDNLERTVNERLHDTRPMWERALAEIAELRTGLGEVQTGLAELRSEVQEGFYNFGTRIELLLRDMFSLRTDHERLSRRVDDLTPKTT